jgi:aminopeptidase N
VNNPKASPNLILSALMKLNLRFLLYLIPFSMQAQVGQQLIDLSETESKQVVNANVYKISSVSQNYDVCYYRLNVYLDPRVWYISGNMTMYFVTKQTPFQQLELDFTSTMQVDSIRYHGVLGTFTHQANHVLKIFLPSVLGSGILDSVQVFYRGTPATTGLGSFVAAPHSSGDVVWTLSQPYGSREWWPNKMTLDDKADSLDVYITSPQQYRGASNGLLVQDIVTDTLRTVYWKHRYPIAAYLIAVAVSNYHVYRDYWIHNNDSVEILNYVYPHSLVQAQQQTPYTATCMELYNNLFEDYPFRREKYGHAQFGRGGGMEHQTMSFMGGFGEDLIAHELAHQWFGDKLTCGSWRDIWLNEGFATYLTGLTYENFKHDSLFLKWKRTVINNVCSETYGSVYPVDTLTPFVLFDSRLTYNKGAFVLHMLRQNLGDVAFFTGVKNYLKDTVMAYGFSSTARFKQHMELAGGTNLTTFFNQWYYNQGYPSYTTTWLQADGKVYLKADQVTSHPSVSFFTAQLQYLLIGEQDTLLVTAQHTGNNQVFSFTVPFVVDTVVFDPFLNILSKGNKVISKTALTAQAGGLLVYPNPARNSVRIMFRNVRVNQPLLELIDATGKQVLMVQLNNAPLAYDWDVHTLAAGYYTLRVTAEGQVQLLPLVKQ